MKLTTQTIDVGRSSLAYYAAGTSTDADTIIHVAGQAGVDEQGQAPADYESQIHLALLNLRKILVASNTSVADILKLTMYVVDYDPIHRQHAKIVQRFLFPHRPATTLVPVPALAAADWLFEVDAVVARRTNAPRGLVPGDAQARNVDTLVVGAGLAGLTAAHCLIDAGQSVLILEGRNRVGGRTWSKAPSDGVGMVDLGAAWINDVNQTRVAALAARFGVDMIEQNVSGKVVLQDLNKSRKEFAYGGLPDFEESIKKNVEFIRDSTEAQCQEVSAADPQDTHIDLDNISFAKYLRKLNATKEAFLTATTWVRAMLGQEPEEISALFFLNYCKSGGGLLQMRSDSTGGGQHLRIRQGTQTFSNRLADALPPKSLELSSPVDAVHQLSDNDIIVRSRDRTFRARKVISAVPQPVLKTWNFQPSLPFSKKLLTESYTYGFYRKVMAVFKSPFWVSKGFCGLVQSFKGPACVIRDTSIPADGKYVLTCFLCGVPGLEWSKLPEAQRQEVLLEQIFDAYQSPEAQHEFVEMMAHEWKDEEFSGFGCPSPSLPPGVLGSVGHALREPFGGVHFVGTETSPTWKGYMEGAILSGERGADEILASTNKVHARL